MREQELPQPGGDLMDRLRAAGLNLDPEDLRARMAGVLAAPQRAGDPDAWMALVAPGADADLAAALRAYRERAAAMVDDGLAAGRAATAGRLRALRGALAERDLDGFIVPRTDAHQGEFVPPHAQRLRWLTGFTGSAGSAVVTAHSAAIFVDGRYTLQAAEEVDTDHIAVLDSSETTPAAWLAARLGGGARVGYDPWLHTPDGLADLRDGVEAELVPEPDNPLDAVWPDQPARPLAPVVAHDLAFAGEASPDKRRRVADKLGAAKADALVLTLPAAIAWLLNLRGADIAHTPVPLSFAVVHADASVDWFVDARKLTPAAHAALDAGVRLRHEDDLLPALDALAESCRRVWLDTGTAPARVAERLGEAGVGLYRKPDPVQAMKARKNPAELAGARAAHLRDGAAVTRFLAWLARTAPERADAGKPVTEIEAANVLAAERLDAEPYRDAAFATIAGAGEHGAIVHYHATPESDRPLHRGELFLCDSGGQYLDGTTDVTRTIAVGTPTAEMRAAYTRVLKGHIALATARFPAGTTGSQLDGFARRPLWDAGMDYAHGTGHGVGSYLGVHEGPQRISKLPSRVALAPGMICSNEPGYYRAGAYGIRIENLVAVTAPGSDRADGEPDGEPADIAGMQGFETLTLVPYDRALIDTALLTTGEIAWVDAYHARVKAAIRPLVDAETADWLDTATAPLCA